MFFRVNEIFSFYSVYLSNCFLTKIIKTLVLILSALFITSISHAQIEVAYLQTKSYSPVGYGAFLNFSIPIAEGNSIVAEAAAYMFNKDDEGVMLVPMVLGYRYTLDGSGTGFYLDPTKAIILAAPTPTKLLQTTHQWLRMGST